MVTIIIIIIIIKEGRFGKERKDRAKQKEWRIVALENRNSLQKEERKESSIRNREQGVRAKDSG